MLGELERTSTVDRECLKIERMVQSAARAGEKISRLSRCANSECAAVSESEIGARRLPTAVVLNYRLLPTPLAQLPRLLKFTRNAADRRKPAREEC